MCIRDSKYSESCYISFQIKELKIMNQSSFSSNQTRAEDIVDSYFECISECSIIDGHQECITRCVEIHLKGGNKNE